ncbi:hypothetical protein LCGC14_1382170 [marine sediment metagenome]|uniref:Uncharacterized protein n=1 Tax=marine sediment metagenome TaxID=412755 RepID=A0A0F9K2D4_9ZZZZ
MTNEELEDEIMFLKMEQEAMKKYMQEWAEFQKLEMAHIDTGVMGLSWVMNKITSQVGRLIGDKNKPNSKYINYNT